MRKNNLEIPFEIEDLRGRREPRPQKKEERSNSKQEESTTQAQSKVTPILIAHPEELTLFERLQMLFDQAQQHLDRIRPQMNGANWGMPNVELRQLPWLKIALVALVAYVLLQKDMQFNLALKAPMGVFADEEDQTEQGQARTTSLSEQSLNNPYAPLASDELHVRKAKAFIRKYAATAVDEMHQFGIPASIKMAQALIESRAGESKLALNNLNFFGLKCFSRRCAKGHCTNAFDDHHKDFFRKFKSDWESWRAHSKLLQGKRYSGLKQHGKDYKAWAKGLKTAGYATDKNYHNKLINTIEKYKLYKLDEM